MKNLTIQSAICMAALLSMTVLTRCDKDNDNDNNRGNGVVVMKANGDINPVLTDFRNLVGGQLNTTPGATGGRREINWDGIPEEMLNKKLPVDFFNPTNASAIVSNQRGLIYSPTGNFQVSKTGFSEVNAAASSQFSNFSGDKSFANISSNLWDVEFQVPGQAVAAKVQAFGIVFSDVDLPESTSLEFFNGQKSLGKFFAPAKNANTSFSFLGVFFKNEKVTRIQVAHDSHLDKGENDVSTGGSADLVVMDNFLYSEPVKE